MYIFFHREPVFKHLLVHHNFLPTFLSQVFPPINIIPIKSCPLLLTKLMYLE